MHSKKFAVKAQVYARFQILALFSTIQHFFFPNPYYFKIVSYLLVACQSQIHQRTARWKELAYSLCIVYAGYKRKGDTDMALWSPWRGCHRVSEGCKFCYIHKGDARRGTDAGSIVRLDHFDAPVARNKTGAYRMKPGQLVYLCFSTDFLIEEADAWRPDCWAMMRERSDLHFLFLTKRIERLESCLPPDWGDGYTNVAVGCTVENQACADFRLPIFSALPIHHRNIICQPLLERIDLERYLPGTELVVAGGESDRNARFLDYSWVLDIRAQCIRQDVRFSFRQCGTHFIKDVRTYTLATRDLGAQARKAGIDC